MVDVVTEIIINRPREDVGAFAADPANAPAWYVNIDSVRWETDPVVGVGSRATFSARFLGRTITYTYEIVDFTPSELLVMRTAEGPFPMETSYSWTSLGDASTHMTLRNRGEPHGFGLLVAPLIGPAMRRANNKDLARLKELLES